MDGSKFMRLFGGIFAMAGLCTLVLGVVFLVISSKEIPNEETIEVVISDISSTRINKKTSYHVYVDYTYKGKDYRHVSINTYSSSMYIGKTIELKLDPEHPDKPYDREGLIIGFIICTALGSVFFIIGFVIWIIGVKRINRVKRLLKEGKELMCIVTEITLGQSSMNRIRAKIVKCVDKETIMGEEVEYVSGNIYIPDNLMPNIGDYVCVYVDRKNINNYYVDIK